MKLHWQCSESQCGVKLKGEGETLRLYVSMQTPFRSFKIFISHILTVSSSSKIRWCWLCLTWSDTISHKQHPHDDFHVSNQLASLDTEPPSASLATCLSHYALFGFQAFFFFFSKWKYLFLYQILKWHFEVCCCCC